MTTEAKNLLTAQEPNLILRRLGWHPSDWMQIEVYAKMSPSRKVAQMFNFRNVQMCLLRTRLRQEHPGCTNIELARLVQEHLDLVREHPSYE